MATLCDSICDSIRNNFGWREPANWAALADLQEEIGEPIPGLRYLVLFARTLAGGGRLSHQLEVVLRWSAVSPFVAARSIAAFARCFGHNHAEEPASAWHQWYRRVPYTGHHNVNWVQRRNRLRWQNQVDDAGGDGSGLLAVHTSLAVAALAVGEFLQTQES